MKEILTELAEKAIDEPIYDNQNFPPSPYYRFLKLLAQEIKPKLSVELGVSGGGGSLHLAIGYPEGQVIGVDFLDDHPGHIEYIKNACRNFTFWKGDSIESAWDISHKYGLVDILFIDTIHTYERTVDEFDEWLTHFTKSTIVCLDDLFRPGMEDAWNELPGKKIRFDFLHDGEFPHDGGFGVIYDI